MIFEVERIERIITDLEKATYADSEPVASYRVYEGSFEGGEAVTLDDSRWKQ